MPAHSKKQQRAMAIELERRREGKGKRRFKSMTRSELKDYAETKRKGLPKKKK